MYFSWVSDVFSVSTLVLFTYFYVIKIGDMPLTRIYFDLKYNIIKNIYSYIFLFIHPYCHPHPTI